MLLRVVLQRCWARCGHVVAAGAVVASVTLAPTGHGGRSLATVVDEPAVDVQILSALDAAWWVLRSEGGADFKFHMPEGLGHEPVEARLDDKVDRVPSVAIVSEPVPPPEDSPARSEPTWDLTPAASDLQRGPDVFGTMAIAAPNMPFARQVRHAFESVAAGPIDCALASQRDCAGIPTATIPATWQQVLEKARALSGRDQLDWVNGTVNATIAYRDDLPAHGVQDSWSKPQETMITGTGDCEDYAILKMWLLKQAGWRGEDMHVVVVRRTDIHSPVDGFVNEVLVTTLGAFVNAGERVVSIVPAEDQLLVEARVRPADIAFIHNGQPAVVKVTAFDFAIFGGLDGTVENVSADTLIDPTTKEPFYTVIVRTKDSTLQGRTGNLEIIPGMVCNVDIMTGKKTIMQYLLKPIQKARETAFRER